MSLVTKTVKTANKYQTYLLQSTLVKPGWVVEKIDPHTLNVTIETDDPDEIAGVIQHVIDDTEEATIMSVEHDWPVVN